nr:magnesium transporter MRS2-3-like [Tanacetum cinerariifolium]
MAEMYLSDKLMQQLENASETSSVDEQDDIDEHVLQSEADDRVLIETNESINEVNLKRMDSQRERFLRSNTLGRESHDTDDEKDIGMRKFIWTVGGCTTGSIFLYVVAIAWCKQQRLLE